MDTNVERKQRGQILVLVAIMLVAMLAMLALVLDGGTAYAKRREAQNAADAGALAGARVFCETRDSAQAEAAAVVYAEDRNGATHALATAAEPGVVTVTAQITYPTYFAHLVGFTELGAEATAAAGCEVPSVGRNILPIGWACQRPSLLDTEPITGTDCLTEDQIITEEELDHRLANPTQPDGTIWPELFILMDSAWEEDDMEFVCAPPHGSTDTVTYPGELDCDLDNDGENDLVANGDRSWLDLDGGGGGADELGDWIHDGFPDEIEAHDWIGGQSGVANSLFHDVDAEVGRIFAVPIFSHICRDYPGQPPCTGLDSNGEEIWHTEDDIIVTAGGNYYYHIDGFAAFYITCVGAPGLHNTCPGHDFAVDEEVFGHGNEPPTIEGYFVYGVFPDLDSIPSDDPLDSGAYTIRLLK